MKKVWALLLVLVMVFSMAGSAFAQEKDTALNIMYVLPNALGDLGLGDAVMEALNEYVAKYGGSVTTFECMGDASLYEPTIVDCADSGEYDLILSGNYDTTDAVAVAAAQYPNQKFLVYDAAMNYDGGINSNVISYQAKQSECGFLAGVLAALMTESNAPLANADKKVGFVGGMENTAIQDFLIGYIEGVNYVDSSIEVLYSFVGNFTDSALAKELTLTQIQQGCDVSFAVCASAAMGVYEAAREGNAYAIGVDYDVASTLTESNPDTADHILTSAVKDFKTLTANLLLSIQKDDVQWGQHYLYGYADGGVVLVENDYYAKLVPEDVKATYAEALSHLSAGEITVGTAIGTPQDEIEAYKKQANPF